MEVGPWAVIGPFSHPDPRDVNLKHPVERQLAEMQADKEWDPLQHPLELAGSFLQWKPAVGVHPRGDQAFDVGRFDIARLLGANPGHQAAFLHATIRSSQATQPVVFFGSDDGFVLWLNGERLAARTEVRSANPFEESVVLPLQKGINHLLIEVIQLGGSWAFEMQAQNTVSQTEINQAIRRGVEFIFARQLIDGSWSDRQPRYRNGATALAVYTLLKSGVSPQHPAVLRGLEYLRSSPSEKTYSAGCELMALATLDNPNYLDWIEERADDLISWQGNNGAWAYPEGHWDLSCTQFAMLGLRAATQQGVDVPAKVWKNVIRGTLIAQETVRRKSAVTEKGFIYYRGHPTGATGSMTSAGIAILAIAREQLGERISPSDKSKVDKAIEDGIAWLAREFSLAQNPKRSDGTFFYYWLYGVERIGALLDLEQIGRHHWYDEGAGYLVLSQAPNGSWATPWGDFDTATCFALLFLRRATASAAVTGSSLNANNTHYVTPEKEGALALHIVEGSPLVAWVVPPKNTVVDKVRYFARRKEQPWQEVALGDGNRFACQLEFEEPGLWQIRATATLSSGLVQDSDVLEVDYRTGIRPQDLGYASDSVRNKIPAYRPEVSVSSQLGGNSGNRLVDNGMWSFWACSTNDASPWLEVKLKKKVKAQRILLTQAHTRRLDWDDFPRVRKIALWMNKDKEPTLYTLQNSPANKTVIELPPRSRINFMRIQIQEIEGGELGESAVGFSEIEIQ